MTRTLALTLAALVVCIRPADAQVRDPSRKWEILDNSFLIEEAFNQEQSVVQNIFSWTRQLDGDWAASFTQEWPAPSIAHQFSYTVPFAAVGEAAGFGDVLLNYRYQLREETGRAPAIAPRVSVVLPTGRADDGLGDGRYGFQMNVPASKQFGDFYIHVNAGLTWAPELPWATILGGSSLWRMTPLFNVMLEALVVVDSSTTLSPGFRRGWNIGERQLVVGGSVPLTWKDGAATAAVLAYASYELPFRK
jgi:hypothetical protein